MANVLLEGWTGEQSVGQRLETLFYSGYKPSGEECHWGRGSIEEKEAKDPSEQTARKILPFWVRISLTKVSARKHKAEQEKKKISVKSRRAKLCPCTVTYSQPFVLCHHSMTSRYESRLC